MIERLRRWALPALATLVVMLGMGVGVAAQGGRLPDWGDNLPAGMTAGPLGLNQATITGQQPVAMAIPDAGVDADVEVRSMIDGVMQDPTGPWVVSWYDFSSHVGEVGNAVFAGHVDYWGVGPSVFQSVASLPMGAEISVYGADGTAYVYAVEDIYRVNVYELGEADYDEILGPKSDAVLTIITCGGQFDGSEYLQRDIIRARLVGTTPASANDDEREAEAASEDEVPAASSELAPGATATVNTDGVNVRSEPTTAASVVTQATLDASVTITGESQDADGYTWWPVEFEDGTTGWIAADFLTP